MLTSKLGDFRCALLTMRSIARASPGRLHCFATDLRPGSVIVVILLQSVGDGGCYAAYLHIYRLTLPPATAPRAVYTYITQSGQTHSQ